MMRMKTIALVAVVGALLVGCGGGGGVNPIVSIN